MVIGDFSTNVAYGNLQLQKPFSSERKPVTLDAKLDPQKPNEYTVLQEYTAPLNPPVIAPPEKPSELKNASKRAPQNTDPVSRAFNAVASYESVIHRIDLFV